MDAKFMEKIEKPFLKRQPDIRPGDTVRVHLRITEAGKERVQVFEGMVIAVNGSGTRKMVTVRKISYGIGVEKIIPVNSPLVKKIDIIERGNVRRAKLYYMRNKIGKRSLDVNTAAGFEAIMEKEEADEAVEEGTEDEKPGSEKLSGEEAVKEQDSEKSEEEAATEEEKSDETEK